MKWDEWIRKHFQHETGYQKFVVRYGSRISFENSGPEESTRFKVGETYGLMPPGYVQLEARRVPGQDTPYREDQIVSVNTAAKIADYVQIIRDAEKEIKFLLEKELEPPGPLPAL